MKPPSSQAFLLTVLLAALCVQEIRAQSEPPSAVGTCVARLYGRLLSGRPMSESELAAQRDSAMACKVGAGSARSENLDRLSAVLGALDAAQSDTLRQSLIREGNAKLDRSRLSGRLGAPFLEGVSHPLATVLIQSLRQASVLSLYAEFRSIESEARVQAGFADLRSRMDSSDVRIRTGMAALETRMDSIDATVSSTLVAVGRIEERVDSIYQLLRQEVVGPARSDMSLGPAGYGIDLVGAAMLAPLGRRWSVGLESMLSVGDEDRLAVGLSVGPRLGPVTVLVGGLAIRDTDSSGEVTVTVFTRVIRPLQLGVTVTSGPRVGVKLLHRTF